MFEKLKKALLKKGAAKRLYGKFEPKPDNKDLHSWVDDADPDMREEVAQHHEMQPGESLRIGNKLSQVTKTRKNPLTGEREFLLHRGVGGGEHRVVYRDGAGYNTHTSWTPNYRTALKFARDYANLGSIDSKVLMPTQGQLVDVENPKIVEELKDRNRIKSAWVPESLIAYSPKQHRYGAAKGYTSPYAHEYEIIVKPFKPQLAEAGDVAHLQHIGLEGERETSLKDKLRNKFRKSLAFHLEKMQKTHIPKIEGKGLAQFFQDFSHHRVFASKDDAINWIHDHTQSANNMRDFHRDAFKIDNKNIDFHKDVLPFVDIIQTQDGYKIKAINGQDTPAPVKLDSHVGKQWEEAYKNDVFKSHDEAMHVIEKDIRNHGLMPKDILEHVRVAISPKGYKIVQRADHIKATAAIDDLPKVKSQLNPDIILGPEHIPRHWRNHNYDLINGLLPDQLHGDINTDSVTPGVRHAKHSNPEHPGAIVKPPLPDYIFRDIGSTDNNPHFLNPDFTTSHREAAYHKMAEHVFGLGEFVPRTALFNHPTDGRPHSAQEFVPNTESYASIDKNDRDGVIPVSVSQKLAIMNGILGNNDRHAHNVLITQDGAPKLIDNGLSFDYGGRPLGGHKIPCYAKYTKNIPISPITHAWIDSLDPEKMKQHLAEAQVPSNLSAVAVNRLNEVKNYSKKLREGKHNIYDDAPGIIDAIKLHYLHPDGNLRQASDVEKDKQVYYGKTTPERSK